MRRASAYYCARARMGSWLNMLFVVWPVQLESRTGKPNLPIRFLASLREVYQRLPRSRLSWRTTWATALIPELKNVFHITGNWHTIGTLTALGIPDQI